MLVVRQLPQWCAGRALGLPGLRRTAAAAAAASLSPPAGETFRSYTYDPVGNRTPEASDAGTTTYAYDAGTTTYAYDAADRLTSLTPPGQAPIGHSFDANGNQTAAGADTFAYDHADRLTSATVGGVTESYTYAGDGTAYRARPAPAPPSSPGTAPSACRSWRSSATVPAACCAPTATGSTC